jgi:hypothetical protein
MGVARIPSVEGGIQPTIFDAKGDLLTATANDTPARVAVGTNEHRLVAASGETTGLKYVADTTNYAVGAKGDLLAGTAADTVAALAVGANDTVLTADSSTATGLKWATPSGGGGYTLINAGGTALTGATSITVSSLSGYNDMFVYVDGVSSANAGSYISLQFNASATGHNHRFARFNGETSYSASNSTGALGNANNIEILRMPANAAKTGGAYLKIEGSNSTAIKPYTFVGYAENDGTNGGQNIWGGGYFDAAAVISSVTIASSGGNLDAGTIYIYGRA